MRISRNRDRLYGILCEGMSKSSWFRELRKDKKEMWKKLSSEELDSIKCKVLDKLERKRKKEIRKRKTEKKTTNEIKDME